MEKKEIVRLLYYCYYSHINTYDPNAQIQTNPFPRFLLLFSVHTSASTYTGKYHTELIIVLPQLDRLFLLARIVFICKAAVLFQRSKIFEDMDQFRVPRFGVPTRKRRSQISRRFIPEPPPLFDRSPMASTPLSDDMSKVSSGENAGDFNSREKMFDLNQCLPGGFPAGGSEGGSDVFFSNGVMGDSMANGTSSGGSMAKIDKMSNGGQPSKKLIMQENSYHNHSTSVNEKSSLQGIPWKDFSRSGFSLGKVDINRVPAENACEKQVEKVNPVRKSKRAPKRRHSLDDESDEEDDAEIRYLEKLRNAKMGVFKDLEIQATKTQNSLLSVPNKSNSERAVDSDYEVDEQLSDGELGGKKKKKQKKDLSHLQTESKIKMTLTTRQRALLSKDVSASGVSVSQIEFPDGLPPPRSRRQKRKLSEVEQQMKKVEAAQRRKIQNEKAAQELEAEAIRKILSQDSSRKKREDKLQKRREELAQEKVANANTLASNTIRWTMRSTGTIVTFPEDMGLPKMFDSRPHGYPPPREKCAGPSCTNPYKYRDSKSKLPLCSLQCYKAIHEKMQS